MRIVLQRVLSAQVTVEGTLISKIGRGILCLVGVRDRDEPACSEVLAKKILEAKLWDDEEGKPWSKNVMEMNYDVLLVSQFTLYGSLKKKSRPDYHVSMNADDARSFYGSFLSLVQKMYTPEKVMNGEFQAYMNVELQNDGPVTLILDTDDYEGAVASVRSRLEKEQRNLHKNDKFKKEENYL